MFTSKYSVIYKEKSLVIEIELVGPLYNPNQDPAHQLQMSHDVSSHTHRENYTLEKGKH